MDVIAGGTGLPRRCLHQDKPRCSISASQYDRFSCQQRRLRCWCGCCRRRWLHAVRQQLAERLDRHGKVLDRSQRCGLHRHPSSACARAGKTGRSSLRVMACVAPFAILFWISQHVSRAVARLSSAVAALGPCQYVQYAQSSDLKRARTIAMSLPASFHACMCMTAICVPRRSSQPAH